MAKRRTAAQKRATRKLILFNKGRKRLNKRRAPKRRKNPVAKIKRRRVSRVMRAPVRRRRANPARRSIFRRGRSRTGGMMMEILPGSAMAAGGALGLDILMGYLIPFLPAQLTQNPAYTPLLKGGMAIVGGMLLKRMGIVSARNAKQFVGGSLTVNLYQVGQQLIQQNMPQVPMAGYPGDSLSGLGWYSPGLVTDSSVSGMNPMGAYDMSAGVGLYSPDSVGVY